MNKEIGKSFQEIEESDLNNTEVSSLQMKRLKHIVKEF